MNSVSRDPGVAFTPAQSSAFDRDTIVSDARSQRFVISKWLRKTHGWIGLWGAAIGLVFGTTGILLNHRAIMKIPAATTQESTVQLPLLIPAPADLNAMGAWLQKELSFDRPPTRSRSEPAKPVAWGDKALKQPEHWTVNFATPQANVQVDYWLGNTSATVKRTDNNVWGTLNNLHKGVGVGVGWVLLADTIGGAIILLSLTGVLLWALTNRRRMLGTGIATVSLVTLVILAVGSL
ncbi:MAG: PepSY-associated TM helix domain-containing protein [Betaproteobacteria bacterium]